MSTDYKYAAVNEAAIFERVENDEGKKPVNRVLMGTYLQILDESGKWYKVETAGPGGWIKKTDTSDNMGLKMFFIDVGQGDCILIEVGNCRIIIDGGPDDNMKRYLTNWQYKYFLDKNEKIKIDYVFITHFDADHYEGLIDLINDTRFTFGTIYHSGIAKFNTDNSGYETVLGNLTSDKEYLETSCDDLINISDESKFQDLFQKFVFAIKEANKSNRLDKIKRIDYLQKTIDPSNADGLKIEVLGPKSDPNGSGIKFKWFKDYNHTVNGHSLVLKLIYGNCSFLLGGDLNTHSEEYLMDYYKSYNPFDVDVAKSCHHGSSEFSINFMNKINPIATVISSGDNENYSHPRADAIGCAGKYSKSNRPLVFSTELARSVNFEKKQILYGLINLRSNGNEIYIAQMNEVHTDAKVWVSYKVKP